MFIAVQNNPVGRVKIENCSCLILQNSITLLATATAVSFSNLHKTFFYVTEVPFAFGTSTIFFQFQLLCMPFTNYEFSPIL